MKTKILVSFLFLLATPSFSFGFAIATGAPEATEAANQVLQKGGNATDAIVAAAFALNVTQPFHMGIGGGGFLIQYHHGKPVFINSRETAPESANPKMFLDSSGNPIRYYPERVTGANPVGIPGMVLSLFELHQKYGKLPWKSLLAPAIQLANQGFPISNYFSKMILEEWERIEKIPLTKAIFTNGDGKPLLAGQILRQPELGSTLEAIAQEGGKSFYEGKLAQKWLPRAQELGVKITEKDLKNYKTEISPPLKFEFLGLKGFTAPAPSSSGFTVVGVMRFIESYYKKNKLPEFDSADRVIVTTEAIKAFQELRNKYIADPKTSGVKNASLFFNTDEEKTTWAQIEKQIQIRKDKIRTMYANSSPEKPSLAQPMLAVQDKNQKTSSHTAHLSIVDDQGNAVSYTTTIENWFGSGLTVPGFGFLLNNELSDFDPEVGKINSPAPGKRPRSNMSPLVLLDAKSSKLLGVVGCAGGPRIPTAIVILLENYYVFKMNARTSLASLRFHPTTENLEVESSAPQKTIDLLKKADYQVVVAEAQNTAQVLLRRSPTTSWEAVSEPRSDGLGISASR